MYGATELEDVARAVVRTEEPSHLALRAGNHPFVQHAMHAPGQIEDGGELLLNFDPGAGELVDYRSTSPSLETNLGDTVGEDFATLQDNWGSDLKPFPLGQPTEQEGIWSVDEGPENKLLFDIQGGEITAISGGFVQICE